MAPFAASNPTCLTSTHNECSGHYIVAAFEHTLRQGDRKINLFVNQQSGRSSCCFQVDRDAPLMMYRNLYLTIIALLAIACSAPQAAERLDGSADAQERAEPDGASRFEARPAIASVIDEAVERLDGQNYILLIAQAGRYAKVTNHTVTLEPRPFEIWMIAAPGVGALVNVSERPMARNAVVRNEPLAEPLGAPDTGMREPPFNQYRNILLDDALSNYWIYEGEDHHHFDEVELRDDLIIGSRSVNEVRDKEREKTRSITELAGRALYVVEFEHNPTELSPPKRAYTIEFRHP